MIFNCRNFNAKDIDDNRQRRRLKAWLSCAGILLTVITLAAMIMSIYLLIIVTQMSATTTGENKVLFQSEKLIHRPQTHRQK